MPEYFTRSTKYILAYNLLQSGGRALVLIGLLTSVLLRRSLNAVYRDVGPLVRILQQLSWLELLHSYLNLAPGSSFASPTMTFVQVASRNLLLFMFVDAVPTIQPRVSVGTMLIAWCGVDIVKYPFTAYSMIAKCPKWLENARFSAFIPWYPVAMVSEWLIYYYALPLIKESRIYFSALPNQLNMSFAFYYICLASMISYFYIGPMMFSYMWKQRSQMLTTISSSDKKK